MKKKQITNIDRKNIKRKRLKMINVLSIIIFFTAWQILGLVNAQREFFNPVYLPTPLKILEVGYQMASDGTLFSQIAISLNRIFFGIVIGSVIAFFVAVIFVRFPVIESAIMPIINFIGPVPVMALLPAIIIWIGIGESSKLFIIAYSTFMSVLGYALDGMKNTDPTLIRSAMSLGASTSQVFLMVIIKSALPNIVTGIKTSLSASFSAMVVAEMMGSTEGLGFLIINAKAWFKMNNMFLAITLIGLLYIFFHSIITLIERLLFKWKIANSSAIED